MLAGRCGYVDMFVFSWYYFNQLSRCWQGVVVTLTCLCLVGITLINCQDVGGRCGYVDMFVFSWYYFNQLSRCWQGVVVRLTCLCLVGITLINCQDVGRALWLG